MAERSVTKKDMLETYVIAALAGLALGVVAGVIDGLRQRWGNRSLPETAQVEMSETDQKMIQETQQVIQECFGENAVETLRAAKNMERISMMNEFAQKLVQLYDLDIDVDVVIQETNNHGAYSWGDKKAVFNIILLTVDADNPNFEACVREVLDTIVHELRHAVQHKAIEQDGYWNVDEQRRIAWANNMAPGNYIRPSVDFKGYVNQPVEADSATFAAQVLQGVH